MTLQTEKAIPILSLVVAALAVFVSPLVSWLVARRQFKNTLELTQRQINSSLAVANKQIIAPMRQKWINDLRDLVAELTSDSLPGSHEVLASSIQARMESCKREYRNRKSCL